MKICFVSLSAYSYFNPSSDISPGGAQRQLYLISQELKENNSISFVVGDYGQIGFEEVDDIELYASYNPDPGSNFLEEISNMKKLYEAMRRAESDIYVYRGNPKKATIVYFLTKLLNKPMVYNVANDADLTSRVNELPKYYQLTFANMMDNSTIICQTKKQKQILASRFGVESSIVSNGYSKTTIYPKFNDRSYFLWVGNIDREQKRPHLFLDLADELTNESFVLIGDDNKSTDYQKAVVNRANSLNNVDYLGYIRPENIHEHYESAIALICTSSYEGFPNTFLEAWRVGTPVLSHSIDPGRFLDSPGMGYTEKLGKLSDMAKNVSGDPALWKLLSRSSRDYFESNYSISSISKRYNSVLSKATAEH